MTAIGWEAPFLDEHLPPWLRDFVEKPDLAIDSLLRGVYNLGRLEFADPASVLIDWSVALEDHPDFVAALDAALARWVVSRWGVVAENEDESRRLARAWVRVGDIVASVTKLKQTAMALRERLPQRQRYLGSLSSGPSLDPLGRYLL